MVRNMCICALVVSAALDGDSLPNGALFRNRAGYVATYNAGGGPIDLTGPFFQSLGANGRTCGSCHRPAQGWTVSPDELRRRFEFTQGLDPIFRPNDGANCDHEIDTSTIGGRRQAYSLLLRKGLIRVVLQVPAAAEFTVVSVINPYGCGDPASVSVYRRPLPSSNLRFLSAVMWDGRESSPLTGTQSITHDTNPDDLIADLRHQSLDATDGHAQALAHLTPEQQHAITVFELALSTAQAVDDHAGQLNSDGANGGPEFLALHTTPAFFIGVNDPLGGNPFGIPFTATIFNLFDAWSHWAAKGETTDQSVRRASILRGEALFNSKPISITSVGGLNDDLEMKVIPGTCGTCHDSPNVGNHSVAAALNIGVADVDNPLPVNYLPVFTLQNTTTGEIKRTTDPGRALITGRWKDIGRLKGPILRGLASRPPYFHNGAAETLADVIEFYDKRFNIGLTPQEKKDLEAFLEAL